jgi:gamma-glutamyltranspeptidase
VVLKLKHLGFKPIERNGPQGNVEAILIDPKTGMYHGIADRRGNGTAAGY